MFKWFQQISYFGHENIGTCFETGNPPRRGGVQRTISNFPEDPAFTAASRSMLGKGGLDVLQERGTTAEK